MAQHEYGNAQCEQQKHSPCFVVGCILSSRLDNTSLQVKYHKIYIIYMLRTGCIACVSAFPYSSASAFVNFSLNLHTHSNAHMVAYGIFVLTTDDKRIYFPFESIKSIHNTQYKSSSIWQNCHKMWQHGYSQIECVQRTSCTYHQVIALYEIHIISVAGVLYSINQSRICAYDWCFADGGGGGDDGGGGDN